MGRAALEWVKKKEAPAVVTGSPWQKKAKLDWDWV